MNSARTHEESVAFPGHYWKFVRTLPSSPHRWDLVRKYVENMKESVGSMKECVENMEEYEEIIMWKINEGICEKYEEILCENNVKNVWLWELELGKIPSFPPYRLCELRPLCLYRLC